jgi:hypothetical protein
MLMSIERKIRRCETDPMDIAEFRRSLSETAPPAGMSRPLAAIWLASKGDWKAAHELVQMDEGEARHDWVHACLHRIEGDADNAGYWYRRAGKPVATGPFDLELMAIASDLLTTTRGQD